MTEHPCQVVKCNTKEYVFSNTLLDISLNNPNETFPFSEKRLIRYLENYINVCKDNHEFLVKKIVPTGTFTIN